MSGEKRRGLYQSTNQPVYKGHKSWTLLWEQKVFNYILSPLMFVNSATLGVPLSLHHIQRVSESQPNFGVLVINMWLTFGKACKSRAGRSNRKLRNYRRMKIITLGPLTKTITGILSRAFRK